MSTKLFLSTFISFVGFIILIRVFSVQGIVKKTNNISRFLGSYFSRKAATKKTRREMMVEEEDSRVPTTGYQESSSNSTPNINTHSNKRNQIFEPEK